MLLNLMNTGIVAKFKILFAQALIYPEIVFIAADNNFSTKIKDNLHKKLFSGHTSLSIVLYRNLTET